MNWSLVAWVAGVLLTFAGIKFVWVLFRTLLSKETMEDVVDSIGDSIHNAGERMATAVKKSAQKHRQKKKVVKAKKQQEPPLISIR